MLDAANPTSLVLTQGNLSSKKIEQDCGRLGSYSRRLIAKFGESSNLRCLASIPALSRASVENARQSH